MKYIKDYNEQVFENTRPSERSICVWTKYPKKFTIGKEYPQYYTNISSGHWVITDQNTSQDTYFDWDHFTNISHTALFTQAKSLEEFYSWIKPINQYFQFKTPPKILLPKNHILEGLYKPLNGRIGKVIEHFKKGDRGYLTEGKVIFFNTKKEEFVGMEHYFKNTIDGAVTNFSYYDLRFSKNLNENDKKVKNIELELTANMYNL